MVYWVYILYSKHLDSFYTGQTQDINKRLARHNKGYVKSTKRGVPWQLIYKEKFNSRSGAVRLERKIKGQSVRRFLNGKGFEP